LLQNLLIAYLLLLRPKQWTKNLLVFAALIFGESFRNGHLVLLAVEAFIAMCLVSSSVYVVNDIRDAARDRRHPRKQHRPIAAGKVQPETAWVIAAACLATGVAIAALINVNALVLIGAYLALQAAYNIRLKHVAVADVFCIAVGFVIRAVLGAAAIDVPISGWLLFCTAALALMLGFSKRRNEFITVGDNGTRESLAHYTRAALDAFVAIFACGAALCYGIYCLESSTAKKYPALILTSIFVFYGIARYVLIVFGWDEGGEPETLLYKDKHILACVVLFIAASFLALSGFKVPLISN
jgi:4-hydroxybenzoate polyprenyltransferase